MSGTMGLLTRTYMPKWSENDSEYDRQWYNKVTVQVGDENGVVNGHSLRPFEECWPFLNTRDVWENSELFKTMREEAKADRQRKIDELK